MAQPNIATLDYDFRNGGSATNGGMFDSSTGGTDYSQQAAAELTFTNLSSSADGLTITDDAAGGLLNSTHTGNGIYISGGTGFTAGWYIATYVSSNSFTVDRSAGASATGGSGNLGGSLDVLTDALLEGCAYGNWFHVKSGTYSPSSISVAKPGAAANTQWIFGYTTTHLDTCEGNDRPLLSMGANDFYLGQNWGMSSLRIEGTSINLCRTGYYGKILNVKSNNTSASNRHGIYDGDGGQLIACCEATSTSGWGIYANGQHTSIRECSVHGCNGTSLYGGIYFYTGVRIERCAIWDNNYGLVTQTSAANVDITNCTIDGNTKGIGLGTVGMPNVYIRGCQITNNTDGIVAYSTAADGRNYYDYNNYYGNTTDVTNVTKGVHSTAVNPNYTDAANGDFSNDFTGIVGCPLIGATANNIIVGAFQPAAGGGSETAYGFVG